MRLILVAILTSTTLVSGCGISGPISSAKNPSGFEGAVYSGRTDTLNKPTKGVESFRVFNQAATGFSTADAQMGDAYERASRFCWYEAFFTRIAKVERAYAMLPKDTERVQ